MDKKKTKWSLFVPLFAVLLLALAFAGCNKKGETPAEKPEHPTSEHPEHPKALDKESETPKTEAAPEAKKAEHPEHPK